MARRAARLSLGIVAIAGVIALEGCGAESDEAQKHPATLPTTIAVPGVSPVQVQMVIYRITLPFGSTARSDEFWKRLDERCVDAVTQELLYKNGLRAGIGASGDWAYFKDILDRQPVQSVKGGYQSFEPISDDLDVRPMTDEQTIAYLNRRQNLEIRSYDRSQNFLTMDFQLAPRTLDKVRLSITPMVRAQRKRFVWTEDQDRRSLDYVAPERFYDLNMTVDIPTGGFFVLAPSAEASFPTSVGGRFLLTDAPTFPQEQVYVFVPTLFHVDFTGKVLSPTPITGPNLPNAPAAPVGGDDAPRR